MRVQSILHVDMDAFYASVEVRDRPELRGKPVIVGGTPEGRGVVAAASYEAREYGVHSAMPAGRALKLCPHAVVLPPRMGYYGDISAQIREIFERFTPEVEPLSLDEAFLDVTGCKRLFGPATGIARQIKDTIRNELDLVASVGVAPNKFLAKLASDLQKPDGLVVVDPERVQEFLDPLPVKRLWGVGRVMQEHLAELGITAIADIRRHGEEAMRSRFGKTGAHLWQLSQGLDDRAVVSDRKAKSVSHETTFAEDISDPELLRAWTLELAEQVGRRLRRHDLRGRTVMLKVRFSDFQTISRSTTLKHPTNTTEAIWQCIDETLTHRLPENHRPVRLVGVGVSGFGEPAAEQKTLFDEEEPRSPDGPSEIDRATDDIKQKFGSKAIGRATSILHGLSHSAQPTMTDLPTAAKKDEE